MLDNLQGSSSQNIVERISALGKSEPVEPTEASAGEVESNEETEVAEVEETEAIESQESDTDSGDDHEGGEGEELYLDIDGEEVSLEQVKEWKSNGLMQADYTRKTMELAEKRKAFDTESANLKTLSQSLGDKITSVESLISDDEKSIDWEDLRDHDPSEYLKQKEIIKAKRDSLSIAKTQQQEVFQVQVQEESRKLVEKMPTWVDAKVRDQEIADAMQYASKLGFSDADLAAVSDHRIYLALINASKFEKVQDSSSRIKKKVSKAPKVLKPSQKSKSKAPKTNMQEAKDRLKKTGSEKDAHAALKALFG